MAVTLGKVNLANTNHVLGNRRQVCFDLTLDASYPPGGYALTLAQMGIDGVTDYVMAQATTTGHTFAYDFANQKLKVYSGGTEITNATDLHLVVARVVASGKGNPTL